MNQTLPSGPALISKILETGSTVGYSTAVFGSEGRNRAIRFVRATQRPPSGPAVMSVPATPGNDVTTPAVVIRLTGVNQSAPSGPAAMAPWAPPTGNSVTAPDGVIRPMFFPR